MQPQSLAELFNADVNYEASVDGDYVYVTDVEAESSYVLVHFDGSYQVRQMLVESDDRSIDNLSDVAMTLALLNERFLCAKLGVDGENNVVVCSDIPASAASFDQVRAMLDQVEYVSGACSALLVRAIKEAAVPSQFDIDAAFGLVTAN